LQIPADAKLGEGHELGEPRMCASRRERGKLPLFERSDYSVVVQAYNGYSEPLALDDLSGRLSPAAKDI
jgi:hypothetical protein